MRHPRRALAGMIRPQQFIIQLAVNEAVGYVQMLDRVSRLGLTDGVISSISASE